MLASLTGLAAAIATAAGDQSMSPNGQRVGQTFAHGIRGSRKIALTFDDGPNDPHTLRLLDVLAKNDVRATFFMIGRYVQQRPDIARAVAQAGHVIGNHTFTHPLLLFNLPLPTQGLASLILLGLFDRLAVKRVDSFDHIHGLIECAKRAAA